MQAISEKSYLLSITYHPLYNREKYSPHIVSKTSSATPSAAAAAAVVVAGKPGISRGQSVLFTNDPKILQVHRETVRQIVEMKYCIVTVFVNCPSLHPLLCMYNRCLTAVRASRTCCASTSDRSWCARRTCTTKSHPTPRSRACAPTWTKGRQTKSNKETN